MQAIDTQDKQFHDGNGTTELGTILPAWWLNQIQAEMLAVLSAANIAPNKAKTNQLAQAIQTLFPNKNFTLTAGAGLTGGGDLSANRTIGLATPSSITATSTNLVSPSSHSHAIDKASITTAGIVRLNNTLTSTSQTEALTAAQGKALAEQIIAAVSNSNNRVAKSGDAMTGILNINTNDWIKMRFNVTGGHWRLEFDPTGTASRTMNFNFNDDTGERSFIRFPTLEKGANQIVAYQSWVNTQITNATRTKYISTENLNDIKTAGTYGQQASKNATTERNYPIAKAGTLLVLPSAYYLQQIYIPFDTSVIYRRSSSNTDISAWNSWTIIATGQSASLTQEGLVQLNSAINNTSETLAATPKAVKTAYDKAVEALNKANTKANLTDFTHSHAQNGYQKLPNGLILQWGKFAVNNDSYASMTFPIAFPKACFNVQAAVQLEQSVTAQIVLSVHVGNLTKTGCSLGVSENGVGGQLPVYWFAIGN